MVLRKFLVFGGNDGDGKGRRYPGQWYPLLMDSTLLPEPLLQDE